MNCIVCDKTLSRGTKGSICRKCPKKPPRPDKFCCGCGIKVNAKQNKSGYCRNCLMARVNDDPVLQEKRRLATLEALRRPETRAKLSAIHRKRCADPEVLERWRQHGRKNYHRTLGTDHARQRALDPEVLARRGRTSSDRALAWCPPEYRDEYRHLNRFRHVPADEARRMIEAKVERERIGRLAATELSDAIYFLKRFVSIHPRDNGYLYGTVILTAEELIARAEQKGWRPERWAA